MVKNEKKRRPKKKPPDRGAGHILVVLDHGTGAARISHDNVSLEQMGELTALLHAYVQQRVDEARREAIREEVLREYVQPQVVQE